MPGGRGYGVAQGVAQRARRRLPQCGTKARANASGDEQAASLSIETNPQLDPDAKCGSPCSLDEGAISTMAGDAAAAKAEESAFTDSTC